jgi:hypothetical protein
VRGDDSGRLLAALSTTGAIVTRSGDELDVVGLTTEQIGATAFAAQIVLYELAPAPVDLERAFLEMVGQA